MDEYNHIKDETQKNQKMARQYKFNQGEKGKVISKYKQRHTLQDINIHNKDITKMLNEKDIKQKNKNDFSIGWTGIND